MTAQDNLNGVQFYHSSRSAQFPGSDWVHVGTRTAAENRAKDWAQHDPSSAPVYMHTVSLTGRPSLATETDDTANYLEKHPEHIGAKITPYTNEYEDPGTTSYLAHRSTVTSVHTERL